MTQDARQNDDPVRWALVGYGAGGRIFHRPLLASAARRRAGRGGHRLARSGRRRCGRTRRASNASTAWAISPALGVEAVTITTPSGHPRRRSRTAPWTPGCTPWWTSRSRLTADAAPGSRSSTPSGRACVVVPYQNRRWDSDSAHRAPADRRRSARHGAPVHLPHRPVPAAQGELARRHGPEQGGGTLLDLGPHLVDQALHLFGPVVSVHADLATIRPGAGAEDDIELHLRHASGVFSTLAAGMASAAPGPRLQVNGTAAGYVVDGFDGQEDAAEGGRLAGLAGQRSGASSPSPPGGGCGRRTARPFRNRASAARGTRSIRPSRRPSAGRERCRSTRGTPSPRPRCSTPPGNRRRPAG